MTGTMDKKKKVVFRRINGRVIPIRVAKSEIVNKWADDQKSLIRTGNVLAAGSTAFSLAFGALAFKTRSPVLASMSAGSAVFAIMNKGFADGRAMGMEDSRKYAKAIAKGKKVTRSKGRFAGNEVAYQNAKYVEKMGKKETRYWHNRLVKGKY